MKRFFALEQVQRLSGLRQFPFERAAQNEIVIALMEVAESNEHGESIVTDWIRNHDECPTPAAIYRMKRKKASSAGVDSHALWICDYKGPKQ